MKLLRILKALAKPRPLAGIIPFVVVVWLASLQGVALYWSIPAGLWFGETVGFAYDFIAKEMSAG